jgi:hypothetical protein
MPTDLYISADVEADGPIPGPYSMSSIGMVAAATFDGTTFTRLDLTETFYRELKPISERFDEAAAAVSGLDRAELIASGHEPAAAMTECVAWLGEVAAGFRARPIFVAYPLGFDWLFTYWYLMQFAGSSPFGHSGHLDMKSIFATKARVPVRTVGKRSMPKHLLSRRTHTHNALDDAIEQAELFANLFEWAP